MKTKAQMEMVGLVVIIVLLSLGMLFMAQFALKDDPTKKIFTRKGLAYSSLSAIMKTTIEDSSCAAQLRATVHPQVEAQLLEDCALYRDTAPEGNSLYDCNNQHSCVFLQQKIAEFLNDTLWYKTYQYESVLLARQGSEPLILVDIKKGRGCPATKERDASDAVINTEAGLLQSSLYICE